jgi:hypothetical protein
LRGAGEPQVFDYHAELEGELFPAGSILSGSPELVLHLETKELEPRVVLKKNGRAVSRSETGDALFKADSPGVYRAEVYLDSHRFLRPDVPWILSNPIFVDPAFEAPEPQDVSCEPTKAVPLADLRVEKDEESSAALVVSGEGAALTYSLSEATPEKIDRWVALAYRKPMDLSGFEGFCIDAESPDTMRYQVEVRSGEKSYYASFKLYPNKHNKVWVPFSEFYATFGGREPIPLATIDSFFILVNTWNSQTGFSSAITINDMGFK